MASPNNTTAPPVLWRARRKVGLHLRSIEEPSSFLNTHAHGSQTPQNHRMSIEQGGTGYGSGENNMRTGVLLQMQNSHYQHHTHQHHYSPHQNQQNYQHSHGHNTHPLGMTQRSYDAEHARMEAWLDENQDFVQDYFLRKATRQAVDAWLVSHATSAGNDVSTTGSPTHANGQNCSSRGGSGATTPVRKISAHEFERGGLLKPIVNTIDGTPTFLSIAPQNDCSSGGMVCSNSNIGISTGSSNAVGSSSSSNNNSSSSNNNNSNISNNSHHSQHHQSCPNSSGSGGGGGGGGVTGGSNTGNSVTFAPSSGHHSHHNCYQRPQRLSRNELKQLDEKELIFELVKDICNELEVRTLCHKILQNVSILLNADRGSLFLVQGRCNGTEGPKKCLVSKLFDVCPRSTVEEMEQQDEVRVAWGTGIAGHVAESGEPVNIPDAYQDERFNCEIDSLTGYRTKALLCMPIKDSSGDVIGVAQVINKLNGECFSEQDEKVFASYLQFCGIGLRNAQLYEKSQLEIKRNQVLLDLARMIFEEQSTIEHMVFRILTHMQSLIQCQRVQILLVHEASKGSFSRVFDFEANDLSEDETISRTSPFESRFPINVGITGYVATTGETVNITNAYEDDRFDPSVDDNSTFKHKSILCMAIKNSLGQIIGVIQLINKFDDLNFTKNDENFVEAFAIFCGMGIHNTHMYEKAIVAMAKQSVTLEVLSYHASATMDEAHRLRRLRVPSAAHFRLHDFKFDDIHFEDDDTLKACLRMFLDLDFVERFHIDYEVLCRWLLSVKKNYRNVTYHNWRHAFNVAQMMFAILTATQWWKIFGEIECLALIIACLCHDLDHRGTNNSFQIKASSPLAQLYSTSTMEHHHFDQCLMILNSPGNQILANMSSEDYCRVVRVLEDAILSTDLAVYFRKRGPFLKAVKEQPISYWVDDEPRSLLRAMSMTVCDLSAITKPWDIEKRVADLVSSEFFEQGDMEKHELNITPIDIMNREKEDELPMMQVGFIDDLCLPIYEAFSNLSDKLEPLVEGVRQNREHWMEMANKVVQKKQAKQAKQNAEMAAIAAPLENGVADSCCSAAESTATDAEETTSLIKANEPKNLKMETQQNNLKNTNEDGDDDGNDDDNDDDDCELNIDGSKLNNAEEEEAGIEADVDDSDIEAYHSNGCRSSASSRLSTPPPTGEDDSVTTSPAKSTSTPHQQAKLIAANLNNLNQRSLKAGAVSCRTCEYARCHNIRKASSLKCANELAKSPPNGCYSQSVPSISNAQPAQAKEHGQHHNQHHHHHHHNHQQHGHHGHHHQHHHHHHASAGSCVGGGIATTCPNESDKIPKIVGKLGNLDSLQFYANANAGCPDPLHASLHATTTAATPTTAVTATTTTTTTTPNGIALTANGHLNFVPPVSNLLTRRHSETNGPITTTTILQQQPQLQTVLNAAATIHQLQQATATCDK